MLRNALLVAIVFALSTPPVPAAGPLAQLAHSLVRGMVQSMIRGQMMRMLMSSGPCGLPLAPAMPSGAAALLSGRMPRLSGAMGSRTIVSGTPGADGTLTLPQSTASAAQSAIGTLMGGHSPNVVANQLTGEALRNAPAQAFERAARGGAKAERGAGNAIASPDMLTVLQDQTPLSPQEVDELAVSLTRMRAMMPSAAAKQCSQADLAAVLARSGEMPMGGGPMRMVLNVLRSMEEQREQMRATFAQMSETDQREAIELMVAEHASLDAQSRDVFTHFVDNNFFNLPEPMRTQVRARLAQ